MKFSHPYWLVAGGAMCLLFIWMWHRHDARQRIALAKLVAPRLLRQLTGSVSLAARHAQRAFFIAAIVCLCAALAGPLLGFHWEQVSRRGNEVVFAIDTSRSMETPDVKPNRLTRAKLAIDDMARQLDGNAMGIVAFAGSAFLVCPLTLDYGAFRESLAAIDVNTIPRGGTDIAAAIGEAQAALRRHPGSDKTLIIVTDGEELEGSAVTAAQAAKQEGLKIFTIGVGTPAGDLIPVPADQGGGFVKDENGALVKSQLDERTLQAIAAAADGVYAPLGPQGEGMQSVLKTAFDALTKHDLAFRQQKVYDQRYQWPLAAALLLLLTSQLIGSRRRRIRRPAAASRAAIAGILLLAGVPMLSRAAEQSDRTPLLDYNQGTTAYRAGQFPLAGQAFQRSIKVAPSSDAKRLADQEDAYYNLGNTLYRLGQQAEKSAPQDAIKTWTDAVKAYDTALQLRPDDGDSKYNRDLVQRKIDALKQPPNPDQNQGQGKGNGAGQGQGQSQGQGQGQGQPPPQGQSTPPGQGQQPPPPPGQGQPPSQGQGQPPRPSQAQGQEPPPQGQQPAPANAGNGAPQPAAAADDAQRDTDDQHAPGQMSREEARELLDSAKSDEHRSLGAPIDRRDPDSQPDKPFKNW